MAGMPVRGPFEPFLDSEIVTSLSHGIMISVALARVSESTGRAVSWARGSRGARPAAGPGTEDTGTSKSSFKFKQTFERLPGFEAVPCVSLFYVNDIGSTGSRGRTRGIPCVSPSP